MAKSTTDINSPLEDKLTCGICRRQVSRYTCPSCNLPYCSLACFRSDEHSQCSEGFYKRELESEIQTQPTASRQERQQMMELLKRFEDEDGKATFEDLINEQDDGSEDDGENELAVKLSGVDINKLSSNELWNLLSPEQREAFSKVMEDGENDAAPEWLKEGVLDSELTSPWWEAPEVEEESDDHSPIYQHDARTKKYGERPQLMPIPDALLHQPPGPPLLYNICAVLISYAFITRHLGISPISTNGEADDLQSAREKFRELVPFVADRRSRTLFGSMDDVVLSLWPRLVDTGSTDRAAFSSLLRDAARLLSPRRVAEVSDDAGDTGGNGFIALESHPLRDALCALSDLVNLHMRSDASSAAQKDSPASAKLRFYMAHLAPLPSALMASFGAEVLARAETIEEEGDVKIKNLAEVDAIIDNSHQQSDGTREKKAVIEEL